jgi:glutamate racemase
MKINLQVKLSRNFLILLGFIIAQLSCTFKQESADPDITEIILTDTTSYFYLDTRNYQNNSHQYKSGGDGLKDFREEYFLFLADQANMPYGNYSRENNIDLLREHIIKDAQFLLGEKYYPALSSEKPQTDKEPVKLLAIACNTASAIGKENIEDFIIRAKLEMEIIGIIDAGAKAALDQFRKNENGSIAVMATAGTVASGGYVKSLQKQQKDLDYQGTISIFQQAGIGLAGAIDGAIEFIDPAAAAPREGYRGPSDNHPELPIDLSILSRYGFDWESNNILFDGESTSPRNIQINSVENYISYHLVTLLENIRNTPDANKLKAILLACTHYPFYIDFFREKLSWLWNCQENNTFIYRSHISENLIFIDPAEYMAIELYRTLQDQDLFNQSILSHSEFYISRPNKMNPDLQTDASGNFRYDYKYGRKTGRIQEYVRRVPIHRGNISEETQNRLKKTVPLSFELIRQFNRNSPKLQDIPAEFKF